MFYINNEIFTNSLQIIAVLLSESMPFYVAVGFKCTKGRKIQRIPADNRFQYWKVVILPEMLYDIGTIPVKEDKICLQNV